MKMSQVVNNEAYYLAEPKLQTVRLNLRRAIAGGTFPYRLPTTNPP